MKDLCPNIKIMKCIINYVSDIEKLKNGEYDIEFEEFGTIIVKSLGGAIVRVG